MLVFIFFYERVSIFYHITWEITLYTRFIRLIKLQVKTASVFEAYSKSKKIQINFIYHVIYLTSYFNVNNVNFRIGFSSIYIDFHFGTLFELLLNGSIYLYIKKNWLHRTMFRFYFTTISGLHHIKFVPMPYVSNSQVIEEHGKQIASV